MGIHDADPRDPFDRDVGPDDGPLHISASAARTMFAGRFDMMFGMRFATAADVLRLADAALHGDIDAATRSRMETIVAEQPNKLPPGFNETLRHHGVDPLAALALHHISNAGSIAIYRADPVEGVRRIANIGLAIQDMTWVRLADQITWRKDAILLPRLPATIVLDLPGRMLRTVLSHPALDPMDLTITDVHDCWSDESMMEIVTSAHSQG